jgi:hypothetical protein
MLTSLAVLTKFCDVSTAPQKCPLGLQQLIGAALLLFVFFLPLHFHFTVAAQVSKECSCVQGTRTQLALDDAEPRVAPMPRIGIRIASDTKSVISHQTRSHNVRGPPATLSA